MRVQSWMTAVACVLLSGGSLARAQAPVPENGYFAGAPGGTAMYGAPGVPCGPGYDYPPPAAGAAAAGAAIGAGGEVYAWPEISPYEEYRFSQHYVDNGLWSWEGNNDPRNYYFHIDGLFAKYRGPEAASVGVKGVNPLVGNVPFLRVTSDVVRRGFGGYSFFADANEIRGEPEPVEGGLRLTWGFFEPDETGISISGWAATEAYWFWQRGLNADPFTFTTPRATAGLPVNTDDGRVTIPYDNLFRLDFSSHGAGADAAVYFTPRFRKSFFRLQPLVGVRYLYINEGFGFLGRDTGANYLMEFPSGTVVEDTFVPGTPYEGFFESDVRSHIFGPEIGIRWWLGGENFRIVGDSRVGLAANLEQLKLEGNAIGDGFTNPEFRQISPFNRVESHGHASPITAHLLEAEMNILGIIPLVKRLYILQHAKLRVGHSVIWAGEVARPNQTIEYNGLPLFPNIVTNRSQWYVSGWHVGLNFNY
ncbi:MAG TPA: hypothetical protein VML55_19160 [Planctomycetaceae bacterium]|nr:hypothetical protein [Planctomycetaceae bacterium]